MKIKCGGFSIYRIEPKSEETFVNVRLYDNIDTIEEAYILAQYAMNKNRTSLNQLIIIFPGWNIGLEDTQELSYLAQYLAEKYKV